MDHPLQRRLVSFYPDEVEAAAAPAPPETEPGHS
jgi:hypothetical protein